MVILGSFTFQAVSSGLFTPTATGNKSDDNSRLLQNLAHINSVSRDTVGTFEDESAVDARASLALPQL